MNAHLSEPRVSSIFVKMLFSINAELNRELPHKNEYLPNEDHHSETNRIPLY